MMMTRFPHAIHGLLAVATVSVTGSATGCGLISSDIATVRFAMPERTYTFDTASAGWNLPPATLPVVPCTDATVCCAAATLASIDCSTVICDATSGTCALTVTVENPPQAIDLKMEVPALSSFSKQSVIDVTISQIKYDVTRNSMNVDLPVVELFVGGDGVTSSAQAQKFGTVPVTPAGMTVTGGAVALDPGGQQAFVDLAHNFGTPFVFLSRTTVVIPGGTPLPMGAVDITIKGQMSAKPGL